MSLAGQILVVDDNKVSRRKLCHALRTLGHIPHEVESGEAALARLQDQTFDLILLDILMPGMDGFDVLQALAITPALDEIPVLVISGLEDDAASVARAIELGATDFLPKHFDAALFRARVNACVETSRLRRAELDHLRQVDRLIAAAEVMDAEAFHPARLGLDEVARRSDAVGKLARVFRDMAEHVYARERKLQRNLRTVKGMALLLGAGIAGGLGVPLSILLYDAVPMPVGTVFWVSLLAGLACLVPALARGRVGRLCAGSLKFLLGWAALNALSTLMLFEAAGHVTGIVLSIILALQGFTVFLLAAVLRIERPSLRRFIGLCVGLAGMLVLMLAHDRIEGVSTWVWIVVALGIPVIDGLMDILVDRKHPPTLDPMAGVGIMLLASAALILPFAIAGGQLYGPTADLGPAAGLIVLEAARTAVQFLLFVHLIAVAGAVFGSQSAYVSTVAGVGWSILILNETLGFVTMGTLALIVVGLAIVGPKREPEDMAVRFVRRRVVR